LSTHNNNNNNNHAWCAQGGCEEARKGRSALGVDGEHIRGVVG